MKTVFNFTQRGLLVLAIVGGAVSVPAAADAQTVFWKRNDLLSDFFKKSERVGQRKFDLSPADRLRIERRLGAPLPAGRTSYTIYYAETHGQIDGYAIIDDEPGEHLPITFAVKISTAGVVERQEIMEYREARGDEVKDARFRNQFVGKTLRSPLRTGDDVVAVSGATISSRAMVTGVKRALVLVEELIVHPTTTTTALR